MSATTQPPDIAAHLDAAERAAATVVAALQAAHAAVPEGDAFAALRFRLVEHIALAARSGDLANERAMLAEMVRVKGPMVEVCYPLARGGITTSRIELAEVTGSALIMRNGERYSRRSGVRAGHRGWHDAPYITEAERARVLALPRPAAAAAKKAPK
jgi:hypothetical protein